MTDPNKLTVDDATHILRCSHAIGARRKDYQMKCIPLPSKGKLTKVLVFGDRNWANTGHIKRVRYVEEWRISKL